MAKLGQIFYGRAPDGYGVLGSSPAGRPFIAAVAALCRAVGSPDRPGDVRPFLLSKREGTAVLMIRACRGAADPTGRATIFFHALVADEASLRVEGLDAFALANTGVFAESCPSREPPDLPFPNARQHEAAPAEGKGIDMPATISSERPLDELVRQKLGEKSLDLNWATFTFNPLPDFDLCVLSSYSPRKGTGTQYAFDDAGLHRLSSETAQRNPENRGAIPTGRPFKQRSSLPLFLSFAVNVVLVFAFLFRGGNGDGGKPDETPSRIEMTEADAREKWERKWKTEWEKSLSTTSSALTEDEAKEKWESKWMEGWEEAYLQKLRSSFEKLLGGNQRISDFEKAMLKLDPYYEDYRSNKATPPTPQAMALYETLKVYVSFVEDTIINHQQQTKER